MSDEDQPTHAELHDEIKRLKYDFGDHARKAAKGRRSAENRLKLLENTYCEMNDTLKGIHDDLHIMKDVLEAWNTATTLGRFIKWSGGIIAALVAVSVALKAGASSLFGGTGVGP